MSGVRVGGREGAWWLPAGGIRTSQGTFSSLLMMKYILDHDCMNQLAVLYTKRN